MYENVETLQTATSKLLFDIGKQGSMYWTIAAYTLFLLLLALLLLQLLKRITLSHYFNTGWSRLITSDTFFMGLLAFTILLLRIPYFSQLECNVDESQWIAGALTLSKDPRYWYSLDGTTNGPLVVFPLLLIKAFGGSINYGTVKLFHIVVWILSLLLTYQSLKWLFDRFIAGAAVLPIAACMATFSTRDFIAYNSETFPVLLLSAGTFLTARLLQQNKRYTYSLVVLLGCVLGWVPYSKLQAVPTALALAAFCLVVLLRDWRRLLLFVGSGILPSVLVFGYLQMMGLFDDFFTSYIVNNLLYAKQGLNTNLTFTEKIFRFLNVFLHGATDINLFFLFQICGILFSLTGLLLLRKHISKPMFPPIILGLLLVISNLYSAIQPGTGFLHYLLLLILPFGLLNGILVGTVHQAASRLPVTKFYMLSGLLFEMLGYTTIAVLINNPVPPVFGDEAAYNHNRGKLKSDVARKVLQYANPGDKLAIWGWSNLYYAETGLPQGCRDPLIYYQVTPTPSQSYYLSRYVADLQKNKPTFFLDTVAPHEFFFTDRAAYGHDKFAVIKEVIDKNYCLLEEINGVRIYVLRNRSLDNFVK